MYIGSILRRISRRSQEAASVATTTANEVIGNIRTVRYGVPRSAALLLKHNQPFKYNIKNGFLPCHTIPCHRAFAMEDVELAEYAQHANTTRSLAIKLGMCRPHGLHWIAFKKSYIIFLNAIIRHTMPYHTIPYHTITHVGIGIGLFQGGSNLFVNGLVLSVLYAGGTLITRYENYDTYYTFNTFHTIQLYNDNDGGSADVFSYRRTIH